MKRLLVATFFYLRAVQADDTVEMPRWLRELTGEEDWPENEPPFIPLPGIDFSQVPDISPRKQGFCNGLSPQTCAFDCGQLCGNDIVTCDVLSQTFDDGPSEATADLLDALKKANIKSTFFTIGENIIEFPEIALRQKKEGHIIATHTWSHAFLPSLSNEEVAAQIQWGIWAVNATAGVVPLYFRPPYGGIDARVRAIAQQMHLIVVMWDHDTEDWRLNDGTATHGQIMKSVEVWTPNDTRGWWVRLFSGTRANTPSRGIILEHDTSYRTVRAAAAIQARLKVQQTVAECMGSNKFYQ